ncbi:hypothetical protein ACWF9B_00575 [Streptomyces sp. NPDC055089]
MVTDQRTVFATEVASIAKKHKGSVRAEAVTTSGYTILFTGMWGDRIDAITITTPDGRKVRRADGWKLSKTALSPRSCGTYWRRTGPGPPNASASRASSPSPSPR